MEDLSGDHQHENAGKAVCTMVLDEFCKTIENAGYYAGIYCSRSFAEDFAEDYIKQYMVFISCSNAARKQEYKTLIGFIVDGAPLEDRMYEAMDGLQWVTKQKTKLLDIKFNNCFPLGEDRYLCDLTYTAETSKYSESSTDVTNTKIILVKSGKKLLVESMQNY